jgi:hypothetical protein
MVGPSDSRPRILRLIRQWLAVGVLRERRVRRDGGRDARGAGISLLLASIFLHYAIG